MLVKLKLPCFLGAERTAQYFVTGVVDEGDVRPKVEALRMKAVESSNWVVHDFGSVRISQTTKNHIDFEFIFLILTLK